MKLGTILFELANKILVAADIFSHRYDIESFENVLLIMRDKSEDYIKFNDDVILFAIKSLDLQCNSRDWL